MPFPGSSIHVLLFDDFRKRPLEVVQELYRFLRVDPTFAPDFETPHNVGGIPASRLLEGLFTSKTLRTTIKPWVPQVAANWVRRLRTRNLRPAPRIPDELRRQLNGNFREDLVQTSELIGRDLGRWL